MPTHPFVNMYLGLVASVGDLADALYDRLAADVTTVWEAEDDLQTLKSFEFVAHLVEGVRADDKCRAACQQLMKVREWLEKPGMLVGLQDPELWNVLWGGEEYQRHFKNVCEGASQFQRLNQPFKKDAFGHYFSVEVKDGRELLVPFKHETEAVMELLAAVWCGLLLCGFRADILADRMFQLANESNGLPSGACVYKAYGDIYRRSLRDFDALDPFRVDHGNETISFIEEHDLRVRHVMINPCIFGKVDLRKKARDWPAEEDPRDLSPYSFRRIAALYYVIYQIAYLRSERHFTLLWLFDETVRNLFDDDAERWLRYAFGRRFKSVRAAQQDRDRDPAVYTQRHDADNDCPAKYGFWGCPTSAREVRPAPPSCVLGARYGVIALHAEPGEKSSAWKSNPSLLVGRRISGELFASLSLSVHDVGKAIRVQLERGVSGYVDCLERAQVAQDKDRAARRTKPR